MTKVLSIAKEKRWINTKQYNLIYDLSRIRNKLMHFSLSEYDKTTKKINTLIVDNEKFIFHSTLIKHLLKMSEYLFENYTIYQEFKDKYI